MISWLEKRIKCEYFLLTYIIHFYKIQLNQSAFNSVQQTDTPCVRNYFNLHNNHVTSTHLSILYSSMFSEIALHYAAESHSIIFRNVGMKSCDH